MGAKVSKPLEQPEHGVTVGNINFFIIKVFIDLGNTKLEVNLLIIK
jgi:methylmalonyl-CoA/ethylmalonyl-CoA epimerase